MNNRVAPDLIDDVCRKNITITVSRKEKEKKNRREKKNENPTNQLADDISRPRARPFSLSAVIQNDIIIC